VYKGQGGALRLGSSSAGDSYMVLMPDHRIAAWGNDIDGQLGDGLTGVEPAAPVFVQGINTAVAFATEGLTNDNAPATHAAAISP